MTEAVQKLIEFGFEEAKANRIHAFCEPENKSSKRVLEKLGMKYKGTLKDWWKNSAENKYYNFELYAILKKEYRKKT